MCCRPHSVRAENHHQVSSFYRSSPVQANSVTGNTNGGQLTKHPLCDNKGAQEESHA
jgi:hypothetical protein